MQLKYYLPIKPRDIYHYTKDIKDNWFNKINNQRHLQMNMNHYFNLQDLQV